MAVTELDKECGRWCPNCDIGKGCRIYAERPESCEAFECFWLQSGQFTMDSPYRMPEEMRPDRIHAVFGGSNRSDIVMAYLEKSTPDLWRTSKPVRDFIERIRSTFSVVVVSGERRTFLPAYTSQGRDHLIHLTQINERTI
jgi:hypothetical protein